MKHKIFSVLTALALCLSLLPGTALAEGDPGPWDCGKTTPNAVTAVLSDGTLTVSGTGAMADYTADSVPWAAAKDQITGVVIENGVSAIGAYAFNGCANLEAVTFQGTSVSIGENAFGGCTALKTVTAPCGSVDSFKSALGNSGVSVDGVTFLGAGHSWDGDGSCDNCGAKAQAKVGGGFYATVQEAFDAAAGIADACTMELLANVTVSQPVTMSGGNVTLTSPEGAGFYKHTLTGSGDKTLVVTGGTLTLKDVTVDNTHENGTAIQVPENSAPNITVEASAKVTAFANGIDQKGGSLVVSGTVGVSRFGTGAIGIQNTTVTVKVGADISSASTLGLFQESGVLTVEGGTISGGTYGMFLNPYGSQKPEVHLSGGTFATTDSTKSAIYLLGDNWKLRELLADGCELCQGNTPVGESVLNDSKTGSGKFTVKKSKLDLSHDGGTTGAGYRWENVETNEYGDITKGTLVLSGGFSRGEVILPQADVEIVAEGACTIGTLSVDNTSASATRNVTFSGPGPLKIQEHVEISGAGSHVTVAAGAQVEITGGLTVSDSGSFDGTVTVNGTLTARNDGGSAVITGKMEVGSGGRLEAYGDTGVQLGGTRTTNPDGTEGKDFLGAFRMASGGRFSGNCGTSIVFVQETNAAEFEAGLSAGDIVVFPGGYLPQDLQPRFSEGRKAVLIPGGGPFSIVPPAPPQPPRHEHSWSADWTTSETHHWHACDASGCTITEDSQKDGYGAHVYDGDRDAECSVCGYTRTLAPEPEEPSRPSGGGGSSSGGGGRDAASAYPVTLEKAEHGKVASDHASATGGVTVTLTVSPEEGYQLDTLTVTDSRGDARKLTDRGGGKHAFTMPDRAVTVRATFTPLAEGKEEEGDCPSRAFADLGGPGTWYHEAVDFVLRKGLMNGYGSGSLFGPDNTLTRAQLVQILYNHAGRPEAGGGGFPDVAPGAWCAPAAAWAAERGVSDGYGDGTFGPDDPITREQLAVMLWRYAGSPAASGAALDFTDADRIGAHAREAMSWAVERGVLSGRGGGVLDPKGPATRAQAAQMLWNFLGD